MKPNTVEIPVRVSVIPVNPGIDVGLGVRIIQLVNADRAAAWHTDGEEWTGADWSNAMCGEAGEAANVVKKLRRFATGVAGANDPEPDVLVDMLAAEIADTFLYLALVASHYEIDMEQAIVDKFNLVSEREGFPHRLARSAS